MTAVPVETPADTFYLTPDPLADPASIARRDAWLAR
jgi:hypothetical protein